jgi:hypothetical protein
VLLLIVAFAFNAPTLAIEIGCSTQVSWWPEATALREMQEIADSVPVPVSIFDSSHDSDLADWVVAHTGNGQADLLILCGRFPTSIYPGGNAQPDGSIAELFLDDGNTIINTGDWMFYVSTPKNGADGLANMMDIPGISMSDPIVDVTPTADGQLYTPSFAGFSPSRPWHLEQLTNNWEAELILGQNTDGTRADPAIVVNTVTGGRLGTFYQVADVLTDERSVVISEWINNWYLPVASGAEKSSSPSPAKGATDVAPVAVLGWKAGEFAANHDVYFGSSFDDVNSATTADAAYMGRQSGTTYDPGALALGETYFWRIDEVNAAPDNTVFKGDVWSFEVEPVSFAVPIGAVTATASSVDGVQDPDNTVNGSGLNANDEHSILLDDMWSAAATDLTPWIQFEFAQVQKLDRVHVWNHNTQTETVLGFGIKEAQIEASIDGENWVDLGTVELPQASAQPTYSGFEMPLEGTVAKFVKVTALSNHSMLGLPQKGLSEVRFYALPMRARLEIPASGTAGLDPLVDLSWRAGRDASQHEVLVGTDPNALAPVATVDDPAFTASVDLDSTVYWQVNEINNAMDPAVWEGDIWTLNTAAYVTVDDMESYQSREGSYVWETWVDGFDDDNNGALLGHGGDDMETGIVFQGRQSLPFYYGQGGAANSEAFRDINRDWSAHGIQTLSLAFRGQSGNTGTLYVKIDDKKIPYSGWAVNISRPAWSVWNIDLGAAGANLNDVKALTIGVEGATTSGRLFIDAILLYPVIFEDGPGDITTPGDSIWGIPHETDNDWPVNEAPEFAIDDSSATKYLHFEGETGATGFQVTPSVGRTIVTGLTFTTANDAGGRDPIAYRLSGSNAGHEGPYTVIAEGDIVDFSQATEWPRFTKNETPIVFENTTAYTHYELIITAIRDVAADMTQIAEVELLGELAP